MNLTQSELMEIKKMAMQYSDPVRGKMLAMVVYIELLEAEVEYLKGK